MRLQRKLDRFSIRPFSKSFRIFALSLHGLVPDQRQYARVRTDRPTPSNAFYGTSKGVPIEIAVQLANAISADAWMNVPVMADDNFIRRMAALVHDQLGGSQKIFVELSNEVWNSSFSQAHYAVTPGQSPLAELGRRAMEIMSTTGSGSECAPRNCAIFGNRCGVPIPGSYVCSARRQHGASRRRRR